MTGIDQITIERNEQLTVHNRTIAADKANNTEFQLTDAAGALIMNYPEGVSPVLVHGNNPPIGWSSEIWNNMLSKPYKERLVIAGALIAAEIDRIS